VGGGRGREGERERERGREVSVISTRIFSHIATGTTVEEEDATLDSNSSLQLCDLALYSVSVDTAVKRVLPAVLVSLYPIYCILALCFCSPSHS